MKATRMAHVPPPTVSVSDTITQAKLLFKNQRGSDSDDPNKHRRRAQAQDRLVRMGGNHLI